MSATLERGNNDKTPLKLLPQRPATVALQSLGPFIVKTEQIGCEKNKNIAETDIGNKEDEENPNDLIPEVYKTQGSTPYSTCTGYSETCLCSSIDDSLSLSTKGKRVTYLERRNWITTERLNELRKKAQDAIKHRKTFTIRGCFYSIRKSLLQRGWVEKLDIHRRAPINGTCQIVSEDVTQHLPLRRPGETVLLHYHHKTVKLFYYHNVGTHPPRGAGVGGWMGKKKQ